MKILIISPGKKHDSTLAEAIAAYEKRLPREWGAAWAFPAADSVEAEGTAILKLLKSGDRIVLFDERGKDSDTPQFAAMLDKELQAGTKRLVFIIGGSYGVSGEIKARAHATLKLSSLTFPHMLVRLILLEQLYRASSILSGGKYHHA